MPADGLATYQRQYAPGQPVFVFGYGSLVWKVRRATEASRLAR